MLTFETYTQTWVSGILRSTVIISHSLMLWFTHLLKLMIPCLTCVQLISHLITEALMHVADFLFIASRFRPIRWSRGLLDIYQHYYWTADLRLLMWDIPMLLDNLISCLNNQGCFVCKLPSLVRLMTMIGVLNLTKPSWSRKCLSTLHGDLSMLLL